MILSEKIIKERKKNGFSQEDLALELGVSRQSVSKWENGISIPDLDKIIKLSEIFGVSTDYLIRDDIEIDNTQVPDIREESIRKVTLDEANSYMDITREVAKILPFGIFLCTVSPIPMLISQGLIGKISESTSVGIGVISLLVLIAMGATIIILSSSKIKRFEFIEKENINLEYGVHGIVSKKKEDYMPIHTKLFVISIAIFILCSVLLFIILSKGEENVSEFLIMLGVSSILFLVAIGTYIMTSTQMIKESYDKLLEEEDYSRDKKRKA